ncbi:MAG: DUF1893 domain-containing protein [Clostridia bacterium]|nr:DUF1893 domain-containing protein [Clostridia bacterium]
MEKNSVKNLIRAGLFMAMGFVLPLLTGQLPVVGQMLLPMHIPVFFCAFFCGPLYALALGVTLPLLRSLIFGVPVLYPVAIAVALEMAIYGGVTGCIYAKIKQKNLRAVYFSMLPAMLLGRIGRYLSQAALMELQGSALVLQAFFTGVIVYSIPGIVLQLLLLPTVTVSVWQRGNEPNGKGEFVTKEGIKALLEKENYTCVISDGAQTFTSRARGVKPLVQFLESGKIPAGCFAVDKVVGKATAMIYVLLQIRSLHAKVVSQPALALLTAHRIEITYETLVPNIINRAGEGVCPFEQAVLGIDDLQSAYVAIQNKMQEMGISISSEGEIK